MLFSFSIAFHQFVMLHTPKTQCLHSSTLLSTGPFVLAAVLLLLQKTHFFSLFCLYEKAPQSLPPTKAVIEGCLFLFLFSFKGEIKGSLLTPQLQ